MRWLHENTDLKLHLLLLRGGAILSDYKKVATVYMLNDFRPTPKPLNLFQRTVRKIIFKVENINRFGDSKYQRVLRIFKIEDEGQPDYILKSLKEKFSGIDLVISNTSATGDAVKCLASLGKPIMSRIAEMSATIEDYFSDSFQLLKEHSDLFLAVSEVVKTELIGLGVPSAKIKVLYGGVVPEEIILQKESDIRKELQLQADSFLVLGSGTRDYQKGIDLFMQLAIWMAKRNQKIHFIWIGGDIYNHSNLIKIDIEKIKATSNLHLIGHKKKPASYYKNANLFLLTSRQDSFPLVALEAGYARVPVLCFEDGGGAIELLEISQVQQNIIPYMDIESMGSRVLDLFENEKERKNIGIKIQETIKKNFTVEKAGKTLFSIIKEQ